MNGGSNARSQALAALWSDPGLARDFAELTASGGRLAGSESEARARDLLSERLAAVPGARPGRHEFDYVGWTSRGCSLELLGGPGGSLRAHPLYWSAATPPEGLAAEVVDLGRGIEADFKAAGRARVEGRIALVRHEYPFASVTVHRRVKYGLAREYGAAGFLIACDQPGDLLVTGSVGQDAPDNIPGMGVSRETGERLAAAGGARVRMVHTNERPARRGANLIAEAPGQGPEWVVVCAHYDGHDLADSALDNATGVVAALAILRAFTPHAREAARGLRVILFTAEESGLLGSRLYVHSLSEEEKRRIAVVINLDTLAGSPRMSCLTSGYEELEGFVRSTAGNIGLELGCVTPLLRNSDHFNFAEQGIPAMRLIAGFDDPASGARLLLTEGDRRERVAAAELKLGALVAAELAWSALAWPGRIAPHRMP